MNTFRPRSRPYIVCRGEGRGSRGYKSRSNPGITSIRPTERASVNISPLVWPADVYPYTPIGSCANGSYRILGQRSLLASSKVSTTFPASFPWTFPGQMNRLSLYSYPMETLNLNISGTPNRTATQFRMKVHIAKRYRSIGIGRYRLLRKTLRSHISKTGRDRSPKFCVHRDKTYIY